MYFIIIKTIIIFNKITSGLINFRSRKQTNTNNNDDDNDNDMTPPCLMSYLTMTDNNPTHGEDRNPHRTNPNPTKSSQTKTAQPTSPTR